ncbi:hypothetical protein E2542_SST10152 [Spatholobus suberectus]|nr:hypothetical protein E2542_SST10152 [Spatholobus suberectus]
MEKQKSKRTEKQETGHDRKELQTHLPEAAEADRQGDHPTSQNQNFGRHLSWLEVLYPYCLCGALL